jgi:LysR family transcriptional regulator, carnitine catabolism transcriptional activator
LNASFHSKTIQVNWIFLDDYVASLMSLPGRLIDAFLALEETRRFALAARRCHVSPSAFSQMISRLEERVGARLFDRDTRNVSLTPEGQAFSAGAHRIASEMHATLTELRERATLGLGRVAVAAPPSLAADWLPKALAEFQREHPGIALRLHDVVSDQCLAMIASGEADFGFNALQGNDLEFESLLMFREPFYLVCRKDDRLAALPHARLKDLEGRSFVQLVRSGSVWQQTQPLLAEAGIRDTGLEVTQLGTLAGLIEAGFGISVVPQSALQLCRRPGLCALPLRAKAAVRPIYRVRRRNRSMSAAAHALWSRLASQPPLAAPDWR